MDKTRTQIGARISTRVYEAFKDLCHSHQIAVERGIEEALKGALDRAGIQVMSANAEGTYPVTEPKPER